MCEQLQAWTHRTIQIGTSCNLPYTIWKCRRKALCAIVSVICILCAAANAAAEVTQSTNEVAEDTDIDFGFFKVNRLLGIAIITTSALFIMIACTIVCHDRMCVRRRRVKTSPAKDKQSPSKPQKNRSRWQQQQQQELQQGTPLHSVSQQRYTNAWSYNSELYQQHHVIALHPYYDDDSTSSDSGDQQYDDYYYYEKRKVKRSETKQHHHTSPQRNDCHPTAEQYERASPQHNDDIPNHRHVRSPGKHVRRAIPQQDDIPQSYASPGKHLARCPIIPQHHGGVFISGEQYRHHATPPHNDDRYMYEQSPAHHHHAAPPQQHNAVYLSPAVLRMFDAQFNQPVTIGRKYGTSNVPMSPLSPKGDRHRTRHTINTHSKRIKKKHKKRVIADSQSATAAKNACPPTAGLMPDDETLAASSARLIALTDDSAPTDACLKPADAVTELPLTADLYDPATEGVSNNVCRPCNDMDEVFSNDEQNAA